ncbi:MAG: hypothetical protein AAB553_08040 [Patescibacteria group bacterium]
MKKFILSLFVYSLFLSFFIGQAQAVTNPLGAPNNKFGIHILFDSELPQAAQLVNSTNGDWGYVLIPIQAPDKNLQKWQTFMDKAKELHLIPILRLSTEGDYFNTSVWRKPKQEDIIDFANFLNSLDWPTRNKYVIVFNEVNRGDEWGGNANPKEYAELLSFATTVFKSKDQDFFIIGSGMDNAAPNQGTKYMNQYDYLKDMHDAVPGIFNQVDGFSSHSYPNPAFAQPPGKESNMGTGSFIHERELIRTMSNKQLPIFITETGWDGEVISDEKRAEYYKTAFETVWNDPQIVTVMPFILQAAGGPFQKFSLLNADNSPTKQYESIRDIQKVKGRPIFPQRTVLAAKTENPLKLPIKTFRTAEEKKRAFPLSQVAPEILFWMMGLDY